MRTDRSILDFVTERSARRSKAASAPRDRPRLDEYLEHVREIERRIQRAERQAHEQPDVPNEPVGVPESYEEHVGLMFDLLAHRLSGRSDARLHVHDGARGQPAHVSEPRRHRAAPFDFASRQPAGGDRRTHEGEHLSRDAVRQVPRAAAHDARRRRLAARSLAHRLRQRHERRQRPHRRRRCRWRWSAAARRRSTATATSCCRQQTPMANLLLSWRRHSAWSRSASASAPARST